MKQSQLSDTFDGQRDALAHAYAHGREPTPFTCPLQLVHGGKDQSRAAHAQRMAQSNSTAIWIHVGRIVGEA